LKDLVRRGGKEPFFSLLYFFNLQLVINVKHITLRKGWIGNAIGTAH
jgi:hypothetical protein